MTMLTAVQFTFFPGVLLNYQWACIESFSWFSVTMCLVGSVADTLGRIIGA